MKELSVSEACFKKIEKARQKGKQHSILIECLFDFAKRNGTLKEVQIFLYGEEAKK